MARVRAKKKKATKEDIQKKKAKKFSGFFTPRERDQESWKALFRNPSPVPKSMMKGLCQQATTET
jgi:hypothetical protein